MKKPYTFLLFLSFSLITVAQSAQSFNYQAVVRGASGNAIVDQTVGLQISILQGSASGTAVYVERFTPTTNDYGLINIQVGTGAVQSGTFSTIDWANGPYFLKTEIDDAGGTSYTEMGTSQLLSVPYALHAETVNTVTETQTIAEAAALGNSVNTQLKDLADPTDDQDAATKAYVDNLLARIEALEETDVLNNGFTDTRDGNHYDAVKIGDQIWMADNLKYLPDVVGPGTGSNSIPYYYVYGYDGTDVSAAKATSNYQTYGVLYNWTAAMDGASSSTANPSGVQGVCPDGWHLPSDAEWTELTDYLGGENVAGGKLKETGTIHWASPNTGATNETGFTALPGGNCSGVGDFSRIANYGYWWSTTNVEIEPLDSWSLGLSYTHDGGDLVGSYKGGGISIRCVRD